MTFNFTTRDWAWFCVVMGLAIGWGMHARHSIFAPAPYPIEQPQRLADAIADYHKARSDVLEWQKNCLKLKRAITKQARGDALSASEQTEVDLIIKRAEGLEAIDHLGHFN